MKTRYCHKDCNKCMQLNGRTDDKGYPFMYECMKYEREIHPNEFKESKEFLIEEAV